MSVTDVNGDPRFAVSDTDYYTLRSTLEPERGEVAVFGVEDSEAGYVAFTTDEKQANIIAGALALREDVLARLGEGKGTLPDSTRKLAEDCLRDEDTE